MTSHTRRPPQTIVASDARITLTRDDGDGVWEVLVHHADGTITTLCAADTEYRAIERLNLCVVGWIREGDGEPDDEPDGRIEYESFDRVCSSEYVLVAPDAEGLTPIIALGARR